MVLVIGSLRVAVEVGHARRADGEAAAKRCRIMGRRCVVCVARSLRDCCTQRVDMERLVK